MMKKVLVALCVVGLMFYFAVPAFSAEGDLEALSKRIEKIENTVGSWSFYGSARVGAFWTDQDLEAGDNSRFDLDLQGNSRFGANVKHGNLGGQLELGIDDGGVSTRLIYGTYNFGDAQFLVGQAYTPVNSFISNQVFGGDSDLLNAGGVYGGRRPMLQFKIDGFKVALVKQHAMSIVDGSPAGSKLDDNLPKIEAGYHFAKDNFFGDVFGGYQTYAISSPGRDYDIDAYVIGAAGGAKFGPAYINAGVYTGQNIGQYGLWVLGDAKAVIDSNEVKNSQSIGALLVLGLKATDMVSFEGGLGYLVHDSDKASAIDKDKTMVAYVQSVIKIAKGFMIVPEVGYYDYKKNLAGTDEGSMWYAGLKTQIDF